MIDRAEVEALLACVEQVHKPNKGVIAELCRVYLAWLDAPSIAPNEPGASVVELLATMGFYDCEEAAPYRRFRLVTDAEAK